MQEPPGRQPWAGYHLQRAPSQPNLLCLQKQPVSLLALNCWAFSALNPAGTGRAGGANRAGVVAPGLLAPTAAGRCAVITVG